MVLRADWNYRPWRWRKQVPPTHW